MNDNIRQFFEKHILPLHKKVLAGETIYLNLEFENTEGTFFSTPRHPEYSDLNNISLENEDELKEYLNKFWVNEPDLLGLIPDLVKLAFSIRKENREQSEELSPFVYTLF